MNTRRHDIDWLRTLAFGLLILYHVGMYYVYEWGWHIKSDDQFVWLQDVMIMSNTWRMSLLFFISAMAMALVNQRYSGWKMAALRSKRLMIPLLFGMAVIVPPQLYYELVFSIDYQASYISFMQEYFNMDTALAPHKQSDIGLLTWNHLWFLPYLWIYSLIVLLIAPLLNRLAAGLGRLPGSLLFGSLLLIMAYVWFTLRQDYPATNALIGDWYNHGKYFLAFIAGYLLASMPTIWDKLIAARRWFLGFAVVGYCLLILDRHGYLAMEEATYEIWWVRYIIGVLLAMNMWGWILMVVGYAGRYLRFDKPILRYLNTAILPFYMLHQTLIILAAVALMPLGLHAGMESIIIIAATCIGCVAGYALIRRLGILRLLFGLAPSRQPNKKQSAQQTDASSAFIAPSSAK